MTGTRHAGRTAVVTGAALGIGRAYAQALASEGARVIVADLADGSETVDLITADGGAAEAAPCDVSEPDSIAALGETVVGLGGADILVHNAGIYPMQMFDEITLEDWRRVLMVNLDSMFLLARAFVPAMRERGWGRVVGISSGMFHMGAPGGVHYVASKGGIIGFIRALAAEVGADGVTANAIAPGLIRSHGTLTGPHEEMGLFDHLAETQAVKRNGLPEDLTGALSFLVSDEAAFMTGQTLLIDGGQSRA